MACESDRTKALPFDPARRGLSVVYRSDAVNHCPGCGRSQFYVGRLLAECAFCSTAIPLVETGALGAGTHSKNRRPHVLYDRAA